MKRRGLFLCTGNSCRSQMAEAIVSTMLCERWQAVSAGTKPAGDVHTKTQIALADNEIDYQGHSRMTDVSKEVDFDLALTVGDVAVENCPIWLGKGKRVHRSFPDPARPGVMEDFCKVRDEIAPEIIPLLKTHEESTFASRCSCFEKSYLRTI